MLYAYTTKNILDDDCGNRDQMILKCIQIAIGFVRSVGFGCFARFSFLETIPEVNTKQLALTGTFS
jgi:hypothetical protein